MKARPGKLFRELLSIAEHAYGRRSGEYKFAVEGRDNIIPEALPPDVTGKVTIYFANEARIHYDRLRLQLAHEAIHFVCGNFKRRCLVFEEGLATHFSLTQTTPEYAKLTEAELPSLFAEALDLFRSLNPSPVEIKRLRATVSIDDLTPSLLEERFGAAPDLAYALCQRVSANDADRHKP